MIKTHCNLCDKVMQQDYLELTLPYAEHVFTFKVVPIRMSTEMATLENSHICSDCLISAMQYTGITAKPDSLQHKDGKLLAIENALRKFIEQNSKGFSRFCPFCGVREGAVHNRDCILTLVVNL